MPMLASIHEELSMHHAAYTRLQQTRDFCATQEKSGRMQLNCFGAVHSPYAVCG
jgi:hypothetical protein